MVDTARGTTPPKHTCASWAFAALIALTALVPLALTGCRTSDELIEVIYSQDAEIVDYQAEQKNYVINPASPLQADNLDTTQVDETATGVKTVDLEIPIFGVPATTSTAIEQVYYDEQGLDRHAPIFSQPLEEPEEDESEEDPEDSAEDEQQGGYSEGGEGEGGSGLAPAGAGENQDEDADAGTGGHGGPKVSNASGGQLESLAVTKVAAVGEYANMTMAIGGAGVLVAADSEFLGSAGAQKVFSESEWGFGSIAQAWTYDAQKDSYTVNMKKLLAADPDIVLVPSGVKLLSDSQQQQLLDKGIYVEEIAAFSTVANIKGDVQWLGESLEDGGVEGAQSRANTYVKDYLKTDVNALISANGGLTTYGGIDYSQSKTSTKGDAEVNWCLLVTGWDATAKIKHVPTGISATGIAIARGGYAWSPVNFYLSAGGVNNNAAQYPFDTRAGVNSDEYWVWQFNFAEVNPATAVTSTRNLSANFGNAPSSTSYCLTAAPATFNTDQVPEAYLGEENFYYLVCTTRTAAQAIIAERDGNSRGIYTPYPWQDADGTSVLKGAIGPVNTQTKTTVTATIGGRNLGEAGANNRSVGQDNVSNGIDAYGVTTCANGLYCNWVDGSIESFLMAFWADDFYDTAGFEPGDATYERLEDEAVRFYREFYHYELTKADLAAIEAGRE